MKSCQCYGDDPAVNVLEKAILFPALMLLVLVKSGALSKSVRSCCYTLTCSSARTSFFGVIPTLCEAVLYSPSGNHPGATQTLGAKAG